MKQYNPTIEYIKKSPKTSQKKLREMRTCLKEVSPKAIEGIKWGTLSFSYDRILYTYAGFNNHIGFYPTPAVIVKFKKELSAYKTAKGSIQFPLDKPLPIALIQKMAKFRIKKLKENNARWM